MSNTNNPYDADYFLRGPESGKSLYTDYRWLPDLTIPMAQRIIDHCGIKKGARVLDFGCARGYLVKALRMLNVNAYGYDASEWALDNADPEVYHYLTRIKEMAFHPDVVPYDWIIAKDVLEHVQYVRSTVIDLMKAARIGVFVVVPLSKFDHGDYVIPDYEKDVTHIQRLTLDKWAKMFMEPGWRVEASYRVPGIKDNYYKPGWERGNGFITARRIEE